MKIDDEKWDLELIEGMGASGEHSWIDFKKPGALDPKGKGWDRFRIDTSKDVSAFSVEGGYIVYGVDGKGKVEKSGGISTKLVGRKPTSEWISQFFSTLVSPPIKIDVIPLPDESGDKAVYVVCIPESDLAPHQALDKKYYQRLGDRSEPLSDALVRALMFRQRYPRVRPIFSFQWLQKNTSGLLGIDFHNYGPLRARDFKFQLEYPAGLTLPFEALATDTDSYKAFKFWSLQNNARVLHLDDTVTASALFDVHVLRQNPTFIFPPQRMHLNEFPIRWTLHADDSPPATGSFSLRELWGKGKISF